jgi:hypothetical protein
MRAACFTNRAKNVIILATDIFKGAGYDIFMDGGGGFGGVFNPFHNRLPTRRDYEKAL